jgi:Holliday junction resolvase RusA-like endonuclease
VTVKKPNKGPVTTAPARRLPIEFTIEAQCYSLKNSRELICLPRPPRGNAKGIQCRSCGNTNHIIPVPGSKARTFERQFKKQLPEACRQNLDCPVMVEMEIFYPSNLQDLDEAIVLDCMQRYGVIQNDRQVIAKWITKRIDPNRPRVYVKVDRVAWERSGRQRRLLNDEAQRPDESIPTQ